MQFRILGPLEVRVGETALALGGPKPRITLAMLLLHANEPVRPGQLAVALWGEDVSEDALKNVPMHVSRLRRTLGSRERVQYTAAGYRLRVEPGELDSERFQRLSAEGRRALADGDAQQ